MAGKRESLRNGEAVELEPGVRGRLNFDKKTLELSDGRTLPISDADKRELFPANEGVRQVAQKKEEIESQIKQAPLGEFFHQFGQSGLAKGAKDWVDRIGSSGDEYLRRKQAEKQVSSRISEESPITSGAATVASFVPDLLATRGMSAAKALPLLHLGSEGSRVLDEPFQVGAEALASGLGGKLLDKGTNYLNKVASRRGASRAMPGQVSEVQGRNIEGAAKVAESNLEQKEAFNVLKESTKNENAARLHQHNLGITDRQNQMIDAKNKYEAAKSARETEVFRLKNDYETAKIQRSSETSRLKNEYESAKIAAQQEEKMLSEQFDFAQKQYQQAVKDIPKLQAEAQQEFSKNVVQNSTRLENAFPKNSKIYSDNLGVPEFIDSAINKTGLGASRDAAQAGKVIRSLFPEGEVFSARELSSRYKAIETAIQKSNPEAKQILNEFKEHLGNKIPSILEDSIAFQKVIPVLKKYLEKDVIAKIRGIPGIDGRTIKTLESNAASVIKNLDSNNFVSRVGNGDFSKKIATEMAPLEAFLPDMTSRDLKLLMSGKNKDFELAYKGVLGQAQERQKAFIEGVANQLNSLSSFEVKLLQSSRDVNKKLGKGIKNTYGLAEPVPPPVAPSPYAPVEIPKAPAELPPVDYPVLPSPIAPPQDLPMPFKPPLAAEPIPPVYEGFMPENLPSLAPAASGAERMADRLEQPLLKGKGNVNNLAKLGFLKYALGNAALPLEAAGLAGYGGLKALTAPGAEMARMSFKQSGIAAIESLASKYASYNNGILESPMDRRSLTREIEDDPEIPPQQKALLQSKVNRGKRLNERIQ